MKHLRSPSCLLLPVVITCTAFLLSLTGCNPNAKAVYDQIKPEFYKDYRGSERCKGISRDARKSGRGPRLCPLFKICLQDFG